MAPVFFVEVNLPVGRLFSPGKRPLPLAEPGPRTENQQLAFGWIAIPSMTALIVILVGVTVAVIARVLAPRLSNRSVVFAITPDRPKPFGYRMSWLAVKTTDTAAVLDALALRDAVPANWNSGIGTVYADRLSDDYVFVTPPVKGWTLIAGVALPHPVGPAFADKLTPMLLALSQTFGDVQYFAAFPIIDFFGWARVYKGRMVRAFVIGDDGVIWDRGRLTPDEKALGLRWFDLRGIKGRIGDAGGAIVLYPTEQQVLRMASAWSCNPLRLDTMKLNDATGFIARVPQSWRAQRLNNGRIKTAA